MLNLPKWRTHLCFGSPFQLNKPWFVKLGMNTEVEHTFYPSHHFPAFSPGIVWVPWFRHNGKQDIIGMNHQSMDEAPKLAWKWWRRVRELRKGTHSWLHIVPCRHLALPSLDCVGKFHAIEMCSLSFKKRINSLVSTSCFLAWLAKVKSANVCNVALR